MAGLDTRGLASGFTQGFGLMNQYQQQERQNERQDKQDAMQAEQFDMQKQQFGMQQEQATREQEMKDLEFTLAKGLEFGPDSLSETEIDLLKNKPQVWSAFDDQAEPAIQRAAEVFDPSSPVDANDPESLEYANILFQDLVNRGDGGQKRIAGFYPAPDGQSVNIELEVTREDGSVDYQPMTDGRGTEEDATVMNVPVEKLTNHIQGLRQIRNGINMGGDEFKNNASRMLSLLRGESAPEQWEQVQGPGGSILQRNATTGEMKSVIGRAPRQAGASGSQGAPTATMKEAQWMVDQGIAADIPSAFETLRRSRGDDLQRDRLQLQTINSDLDRIARRLSNMRPSHDGYAELSDEYDRLVEQRNAIAGQVFDSGGDASQQAQATEGAEAPTAAAMADDDLLNSILRDL